MSGQKWLPAHGGRCTHKFEDGRFCGLSAVIVSLDHSIHLCKLHEHFSDPDLRAAREEYLKRLEGGR